MVLQILTNGLAANATTATDQVAYFHHYLSFRLNSKKRGKNPHHVLMLISESKVTSSICFLCASNNPKSKAPFFNVQILIFKKLEQQMFDIFDID